MMRNYFRKTVRPKVKNSYHLRVRAPKPISESVRIANAKSNRHYKPVHNPLANPPLS